MELNVSKLFEFAELLKKDTVAYCILRAFKLNGFVSIFENEWVVNSFGLRVYTKVEAEEHYPLSELYKLTRLYLDSEVNNKDNSPERTAMLLEVLERFNQEYGYDEFTI